MKNKRKRYGRKAITAICVVLILSAVSALIGAWLYETGEKTETKAITDRGAYDREVRSVSSAVTEATVEYVSTTGPLPQHDYSVGTEKPEPTQAATDVTQEEYTATGNSYYSYCSGGNGPGDTANVNTNPSIAYYTTEQLEKGLLYELKQYAYDFVQAQEKYRIDAVFLAAVAAEESGYGRYTFRQNNIFGYHNKDFDSVPQCIEYVASHIRGDYLTPDGQYYTGCSVADISVYYNEGRSTWVSNVTALMGEIKARIEYN